MTKSPAQILPRERDRNLSERTRTLGLINLLEQTRERRTPPRKRTRDESPTCGHGQTHRRGQSEMPWRDDYLFTSEALRERLIDGCALDPGEHDLWSFSDHCPVVAELKP